LARLESAFSNHSDADPSPDSLAALALGMNSDDRASVLSKVFARVPLEELQHFIGMASLSASLRQPNGLVLGCPVASRKFGASGNPQKLAETAMANGHPVFVVTQLQRPPKSSEPGLLDRHRRGGVVLHSAPATENPLENAPEGSDL
jgi:hypothetical protein